MNKKIKFGQTICHLIRITLKIHLSNNIKVDCDLVYF